MVENETLPRDMNVGDVLDYAIEAYKRNFKQLTILAAIFYVPFITIYAGVSGYIYGDMVSSLGINFRSMMGGAVSGKSDMSDFPMIMMAYYLTMLVMGLVYGIYSLTVKAVMDAAVIKIVYNSIIAGNPLELRMVIKESFRRFPSIAGNSFLYGLIILGIGTAAYIALILLIIVVGISAALMAGVNGNQALGNVIAVVFVILLVAVIVFIVAFVLYFMARYSLGLQAVVLEKKSAVEGISRCNRLASKKFRHLLFSYTIGILLFFTIPAILNSGAQLLIYFNKNIYMMALTVTQVLGALASPFMATLTTVIFISLKIKKEGLDLELKVDRLLEREKFLRGRIISNGDTADAGEV